MSAGLTLSTQTSRMLASSIERTKSQSAVLFLCDTTAPAFQLHPLFVHGLSSDAIERYSRSSVYSHDPFLTAHVTQRSRTASGKVVIDPGDQDLGRDPMAAGYWTFLSDLDLRVTGAVIKSVSSTMFLVGRLYRGAATSGGEIAIVADEMGDVLDRVASQMMSVAARSLSADPRENDANDMTAAESLGLSRRQCAIIELLRAGLLNKQIAFQLSLPEHTVENDLRYIYRKLGVQNRVALVGHLSGRQTRAG